jgi:hypothetical protein
MFAYNNGVIQLWDDKNVIARDDPEIVYLPAEMGTLLTRIDYNRHNLDRLREAVLILGLTPTDWRSY